jgi:hypothetical protein
VSEIHPEMREPDASVSAPVIVASLALPRL